MSLDHDDQNDADRVADHFMEDNWPPQNISMAVPDKSNKKKPGIIFLSSIPPGFNVSTSIAFFSQFGKVGRVFLQPGTAESKTNRSLGSVWSKMSIFKRAWGLKNFYHAHAYFRVPNHY